MTHFSPTRSLVVVTVVLAVFIAACQRESVTPGAEATAHASAKLPDGCRLGTKLGPEGNVAEAKSAFGGREPIFLTLAFAQAKPGLQITVEILDYRGEEVKSLFKSMDNEKIATVPLRNLAAGRYTARATWGDTRICEVPFEIQ